VTHLDDSMVSTHDGGADADATLQIGHSSPPPTMTQVITSIRELRYEQTKLLPHLVTNSSCQGTAVSNGRDQA
jgi:hypothetical protein